MDYQQHNSLNQNRYNSSSKEHTFLKRSTGQDGSATRGPPISSALRFDETSKGKMQHQQQQYQQDQQYQQQQNNNDRNRYAAYHHNQDNCNDEEEEYERRREEELKRKIKEKESEIQNLSKASDFLRSKLDSQMGQKQPDGVSQQRYASFGRQQPERDHSPFTPQSQSSSQYKFQEQPNNNNNIAPPHIREHLANLQSDNASLMRRLNLVLQELERVTKEKDDIQSRLQHYAKESMNLQRMISGEDNVDKVNKYMGEDLAYEKDRNFKLKKQIQEQDSYKQDLIKELRKYEDAQQSQVGQSQNLAQDLQNRIAQITDLEKEMYFTQEKVKQLSIAIDQGKRDEHLDNAEKVDLDRLISQLMAERNDLLSKLDNLTQRYDECVREISRDRQEMERHNKQHSKLVTAKVLFQELESCLKSRQKQAFHEIKVYCTFDNKCHKKLLQFSKVLNIVGRYKQKIGIQQWYQNALKPLEIKVQSYQIARNIDNDNIKAKYMQKWFNKYQQRINAYELKTKAVEFIWKIKKQDAEIEQKRAFTIWKLTLDQFKLKKKKIQKLIWSQYFTKLSQALSLWQSHSHNIDSQVRLSLLSQKFTHKQYLNLIFCNFKEKSYDMKRRRLNTLFHCVKYWKDYINYRKFLMGAQVSVLQFQKEQNTSLMKECFDCLRIKKEEEKYNKVHQELNEVELPRIQELQEILSSYKSQDQTKAKTKAGQALINLANKQMYEYFLKWKQVYINFKEVPNSKIKGRIIKAYYDKLRMAFNRFKVNANLKKMNMNQVVIMEQQEEQKELTEQVITLQKDIKGKKELSDQSQRKNINKCVQSLQRRMLKEGLARWKFQIESQNSKQSGASTVVHRLRTRLLRQAFTLYHNGVKYHRKLQIDEERCQYYNKTRAERLKQLVFSQWKLYKQDFQKSKQYWYRIYLRMDRNLTEKGFKKWKEGSQLVKEEELQRKEQECIEVMTELNQEIGQVTGVEEAQTNELKNMKGALTKQAQRVLANRFANYYYVGETRGFEKWKEYTIYEKRKEAIMRKMIEHWRKYQFYYVKSTFKNWIQNANIQEKKDQLKKEEQKLKDVEFAFDNQKKQFNDSQSKLQNELQEIKKLQQVYNSRLQKSIQMIVTKVDKNDFMSQKRYILQQWRSYVKREINFIKCIKNVVQKSLWTEGFKQIKAVSFQSKQKDNQYQVLNRFRLKFWKRTCGNAFSKWRQGQFSNVFETIEETVNQTNEIVQEHDERVQIKKKVNSEKAGRVLGSQNLKNLWTGWFNVAHFLKTIRIKNQEFQQSMVVYKKREAVQKWQKRKQATTIAQIRYKRLRQKVSKLRLLFVFQALKQHFYQTKDLAQRLANLGHVLDLQGVRCGFNGVKSYAKAKVYVHERAKEHSSRDISQALQRIVLRKKTQYMNDLKYQTLSKYRQTLHKFLTLSHSLSHSLRHHFSQWKSHADLMTLAQEMHNEGPIREAVFEERVIMKGCQGFMKDEGYSQNDIQDALQAGKVRQSNQMLKGIRRLQHYNEELYCKPLFFDMWKNYVQERKKFKQWLQFAAKRSQYGVSDLAVAFDRWKKFDKVQRQTLKCLPKKDLDTRVLKNSSNLGTLSSQVQDLDQSLAHLSLQRDELVENYIKGQKLALALWVNKHRRAQHRALLRWKTATSSMRNSISDARLRKNVELIAALKEKIRNIEKDNYDMSNENEELRQFSLDGYEIAKNVQALSQEREKLSVDLADKAQTIRKLLDENEKLNKKLKFAQDEAHSLIKSTNNKINNSSNAKQYQSPLIRHNAY